MVFFWGFIILGWCFNFIMFLRHQEVFNFRQRLLRGVDEIARPEVALKYLNEMVAVDYHKMVWQFWKPCRSFYSEEVLKLLDD